MIHLYRLALAPFVLLASFILLGFLCMHGGEE